MKPICLLVLQLLLRQTAISQGLPPIGQWRDHLPMSGVMGIMKTGNSVLAITRSGYFTADAAGNEVKTYTRSNGLSDVNLRCLTTEPAGNGIAIGYESAMIDLIVGDRTRTIPDIALNRTEAAKKINHINWLGNEAYVSTGFGIILLNIAKAEVAETFRLGENGGSIQVHQVAILNDTLYAASEKGLKKVPFDRARMRDYGNWQQEGVNGLLTSSEGILNWGNRLVAWSADSIFERTSGQWKYLASGSGRLTFVFVDGGMLAVGRTEGNVGVINLIQTPGQIAKVIQSKWLVNPSGYLQWNGVEWLSDSLNGLIRKEANTERIVVPESPLGIPQGTGISFDGEVWITGGTVKSDGTASGMAGWVTRFNGTGWKNWTKQVLQVFDSLPDIQAVVPDPVNGGTWAGSFGGGLLYLSKDGKASRFLHPILGEDQWAPGTFKVGGLAYDRDMNLWMTNSGALQPVVMKRPDGKSIGFNSQIALLQNRLTGIQIDVENRKWMIAPALGLVCWDDRGTPERISDDRWRLFRQGRGNGNLPSGNVLSVACDKDGIVWVGTERGIALIQCGEDIFSGNCDAVLPVVQQGNYSGLLLSEEMIYDIKVDPGNRKWVATSTGVWLLSEDGQKVIFNFTKSNSRLLDNKVYGIVPENQNGEIFFLTASGICSFRSTATSPAEESKPLFIYPNPVPSGFTGTIGIRGLPEEAWVKITSHDGKLVYQTRSLGGQAIWNGKDLRGNRLNTGVFMVIATDKSNNTVSTGKIFFIK